jgi:hypothetical protein
MGSDHVHIVPEPPHVLVDDGGILLGMGLYSSNYYDIRRVKRRLVLSRDPRILLRLLDRHKSRGGRVL